MKKLLLLSVASLGTILMGCAGGSYAAVRVGPPPAPRYGVMGFAPGPGYVWTDGYWDQRGGHWVWINGRWLRPPRAHVVWVPGVWHQNGNRWRFERGHWR